ncbi:hypothetical protein TNCV_3429471 [Trichonephila clavipes]|nr:hypothetical protein TNCV_3429471 [Trichonephila clavipes]
MPETHSEKRKFGKAVESSANKKARREVSKKYGKFTEDCIPDGVFPIGDDVASTFRISTHKTLQEKWKNILPNSPGNNHGGSNVSCRIQYGPDKEPTFKEITISREQWIEMTEKYGAIENAAVDNMFQLYQDLAAFYENPEVPNSFGGVEALHRSVKGKYSKKDVKHWLSQKDAYTLHKPVRHKFQRNRVFVSDIDRQSFKRI